MLKSKLLLSATVLGMGLGIAGLTTTANAAEIEVQSGDTLSLLAEKHNTTVDNLVQLNGIENANLIFVGEKLITDANDVATGSQAVQTAPVAQVETAPVVESAPVQETAPTYSGSSSSAKEEIARRESSGSYSATNGQYIGRYQLTNTYLNGDYSPENQERVADSYVASRYGSWEKALEFHNANGWY